MPTPLPLIEALKLLRAELPPLARALGLEEHDTVTQWCEALDRRLLARLAPDAPLVGAICGGGSSGKSTLFNTLAGAPLSPVGGRAGMNRRTLVGLHPQRVPAMADLLPALCPNEHALAPLDCPAQLTTAGPPLYAAATALPRDLILLDTPDFDTGAAGVYTNRSATQAALGAADLLIYIFTNSNYSNRDNTDFIAQVLTGIGRRPCLLVYRAYPSFSAEDVQAHARVVAENLYGAEAANWVLGVFRAAEDNAVAAGDRPVAILPAAPDGPSLETVLARLDPRSLRLEALRTLLVDLLQQADRIVTLIGDNHQALERYDVVLRAIETRAAQDSLRHFPADAVMRRFAALWLASDPPYLRAMRAAGRVLDLPLRLLLAVARTGAPPARSDSEDFAARVTADLEHAATRLRLTVVSDEIALALPPGDPLAVRLAPPSPGPSPEGEEAGKTRAAAPAAVREARARIAGTAWNRILPGILNQGETILCSSGIDGELRSLADRFRSSMGFMDRVRQTFSAALNILPATAAVTWIVSTGDPVGAVGLKVKLTGLLGLHDLYALVALPATSGLKKADRLQLEELLAPVAKAWLARKLNDIQALLRSEITGPVMESAETLLVDTAAGLARAADALKAAKDACP